MSKDGWVPQETYETSGPRCPECGHLHRADEAFYYDEGLTELDCEHCSKAFAVAVHRSTSWRCEPLPPPPSTEQG